MECVWIQLRLRQYEIGLILHTVHGVRSFLGLCSYYKAFIRHLSEIAAPLHNLTRKGVKFRWEIKEKQAFHHLKEKLSSQPVLILPDLRKPFVVQCDACGHSIGAALMHDDHVVAYESRILLPTEKNLQVYEKKLLVVLHAL